MDHLRLVQPDDRLAKRVVVRVADAAHRAPFQPSRAGKRFWTAGQPSDKLGLHRDTPVSGGRDTTRSGTADVYTYALARLRRNEIGWDHEPVPRLEVVLHREPRRNRGHRVDPEACRPRLSHPIRPGTFRLNSRLLEPGYSVSVMFVWRRRRVSSSMISRAMSGQVVINALMSQLASTRHLVGVTGITSADRGLPSSTAISPKN